MADVLLAWNNDFATGDLCVAGPDLAADDGLQTAVLMSLFTDRRVAADELPPGETGRRGWWGDALGDVPGDRIGSKLWTLEREKQTPEVLARSRGYAIEALQWLLDDGLVTELSVEASWRGRGKRVLDVRLTLPDRTSREYTFETPN